MSKSIENYSAYPHPPPQINTHTSDDAPPNYDQSENGFSVPPQPPLSSQSQDHRNFGQPPMMMQYQDHPNRVIIEQPVVLAHAQIVGPHPTQVTCSSCNSPVMTRIDYEISTKTHLVAGILCLLGLWCCVCIPYCVKSCQNKNHYCPNCGTFIGSHKA